MTLTAIQAAQLTVQTSGRNHIQMGEDYKSIMTKVYSDIQKACTDAVREHHQIRYEWNVARPKEFKELFGDVKHLLYHWDGGEGRNDRITPLGTMVQEALREDGYQVSLYSSSLTISWEHLIEDARKES